MPNPPLPFILVVMERLKQSPRQQRRSAERYTRPAEKLQLDLTPEQALMSAEAAVTRVMAISKGPRIPSGLIIQAAFGTTRIDSTSHELFVEATSNDPRISFVGRGEYEIVGDNREQVIDTELVDQLVARIVDMLEHHPPQPRLRNEEITTMLRVQGFFLTREELALLFEKLNSNPHILVQENGRYIYQKQPTERIKQNLGKRSLS